MKIASKNLNSYFYLLPLAFCLLPYPVFAQTGVITTVAGSQPVFQGNGGPAANAIMGLLDGVLVDSQGNIYLSDSDNCVVARINSSGIINIVAGNGVCGYSGDGGP